MYSTSKNQKHKQKFFNVSCVLTFSFHRSKKKKEQKELETDSNNHFSLEIRKKNPTKTVPLKKIISLVLFCVYKKTKNFIMTVRRPLWSFFVPSTSASKVRKISVAAPLLLFVFSVDAILAKQEHLRGKLADEDADVADRIARRSYVALPNGEMALVHPKINTDFSIRGILRQIVETFNPMP
jgi:hypothetical protein